MTRAYRMTLRFTRKTAVLVAGVLAVLAGAALVFLPGPGLLVAVAGFAILGIEFEWARRWGRHVRARVDAVVARWEGRLARRSSRRGLRI
jgi:uncharacterized protein (TIGR02611 family)